MNTKVVWQLSKEAEQSGVPPSQSHMMEEEFQCSHSMLVATVIFWHNLRLL